MNMRKKIAGMFLGTGLILLIIAGSGLTTIAGSDAPYNAALKAAHEGTVFGDATQGSAEECDVPGMVAGRYYWHFVIPDNTQSFVSIEVTFQNAGVVTDFFSFPTNKHAYVATDTADTLLSARAVVTPGISGEAVVFNLSHVCAPTAPPVTTTTMAPTTTTVAPTSSVSPTSIVATTTTMAPTTTTVAPTSSVSPTSIVGTTTTSAPASSVSPTSIVATTTMAPTSTSTPGMTEPTSTVAGVAPAATEPEPGAPAGTRVLASTTERLPQTGSRAALLAAFGCLSIAAGIALLAATRRTSASD